MKQTHVGFTPISEKDARMLSPLKLAYLGDVVLDFYVRDYMVKRDLGTAGALHKNAITIVNASAQAKFVTALLPDLTEDEAHIFKRGRNAKSGMTPKNSNVADYRIATGFEALLGYLYAYGDYTRLHEILNTLIDSHF